MWIIVEKNGVKQKVQPGQTYPSDWKATGEVEMEPGDPQPFDPWRDYPFRRCSSCKQMGIYEST
jgi:hypothetical protein